MQYVLSQQSSDGDPMETRYTDWYKRLRALSYSSDYEAACLELARAQGYDADIEDNDLKDSKGSLVSDGTTTWSDSQENSDGSEIASEITGITRHHREQMDISNERADRLSRETLSQETPSDTRMTTSSPVESDPVIRAWTKEMDTKHAREREIAWVGAAWAFRYGNDVEVEYGVLKTQLAVLQRIQEDAKKKNLAFIKEWHDYDENGEWASQ